MHLAGEIITYILIFIALYLEVFLLINYLELRDEDRKALKKVPSLENKNFPSVSIIVPVWNEERTVEGTIQSLLNLNYPKDKLFIYIVDDGSTDSTWSFIQKFSSHQNIKLLQKENGGKHTALNYALKSIDTDLVGCLDADSYVDSEALLRIVPHFDNPKMMTVTPSTIIHNPKGVLQLIQKTEYIFGIFLRRVFAHLDSIYITPGPFSIFRRSVFEKIGPYRHAYLTEDMEIGMRMQKNGMKIGNAHNAYVYTVAPNTIKTLFKQRLRWVYGFLKNAIDYRDMFFRPKYGNLGVIILPAAGFSIFSTLFLFGSTMVDWASSLWKNIEQISTVGFHLGNFNFDLFYVNTDIIVFVSLIAVLGTVYIIITSRGIVGEKYKFGLDSLLFLLLYTAISPFWMTKALYNVVFAKNTKWR